tara:strand:- start:505 stop:1218 length:714 start_codon:yes stop_codon:yes gene_type:complete
MASSSFERYEEDYSSLAASLTTKVASLTEKTGEARKAAAAAFEKELLEAQDLIKSMDLEARSVPAEKAKLQARVKSYKSDIAALKTRLKDASSAASRAELGLAGMDDNQGLSDGESASQRSRLLASSERVEAGTSKLKATQQVLAETEAVGASILGDLRAQRETIVRSSAGLRGVSDQLDKSGRKLREMARRAMANKLIMYVLIGLLGVCSLALLYIQIFGASAAPASPPPPRAAGR